MKKIWIDILTPKQLLFAHYLSKKFSKRKVKLIFTSRQYDEVESLAKLHRINLTVIGKHGGGTKIGKLEASSDRTLKLAKFVHEQEPDYLISFCSPEATRVAYGLGIKHIAFTDSPHAEAVMRLCLPYVTKLMTPWIIPKSAFTKYGIAAKDIIHYRTIDANITLQARSVMSDVHIEPKKIVVRLEEDQASYVKITESFDIADRLTREFETSDILVLGRYDSQIKKFKEYTHAPITKMAIDGKKLLENTSLFIGSGGTMTAESALMGVPTITFSAAPNFIEQYLIKKKLIIKETDPEKIIPLAKKLLEQKRKPVKLNLNNDDVFEKLITALHQNKLNILTIDQTSWINQLAE